MKQFENVDASSPSARDSWKDLIDIMTSCWKDAPDKRPTFA